MLMMALMRTIPNLPMERTEAHLFTGVEMMTTTSCAQPPFPYTEFKAPYEVPTQTQLKNGNELPLNDSCAKKHRTEFNCA